MQFCIFFHYYQQRQVCCWFRESYNLQNYHCSLNQRMCYILNLVHLVKPITIKSYAICPRCFKSKNIVCHVRLFSFISLLLVFTFFPLFNFSFFSGLFFPLLAPELFWMILLNFDEGSYSLPTTSQQVHHLGLVEEFCLQNLFLIMLKHKALPVVQLLSMVSVIFHKQKDGFQYHEQFSPAELGLELEFQVLPRTLH